MVLFASGFISLIMKIREISWPAKGKISFTMQSKKFRSCLLLVITN